MSIFDDDTMCEHCGLPADGLDEGLTPLCTRCAAATVVGQAIEDARRFEPEALSEFDERAQPKDGE